MFEKRFKSHHDVKSIIGAKFKASKRMVTPTTCHHPPFTFSFSSGVRVLIIAVIMKCLLSYTIAVTYYSRLCHVRNFTYFSVAFNNK